LALKIKKIFLILLFYQKKIRKALKKR